jgi:hypothetical protein
MNVLWGATSSDTSRGSMVHKEPKKPEPKEKADVEKRLCLHDDPLNKVNVLPLADRHLKGK